MFFMLSSIAHSALYCARLATVTAYRARQLRIFECRQQDAEHWLWPRLPACLPLMLQLCVFLTRSFCLVNRVLLFIQRQFAFHFVQEINIVFLAQIREENEDVGDFMFDVSEFFVGELAGLLRGLPKEVFKQPPPLQWRGLRRGS
jgi:hypothetical protein